MRKNIILLFLFGSFNLLSQTSDTISLWQCIFAGIDNYGLQQSLDYSNQTVDLQQNNLKTNYYPVIKLNGQATFQSSTIEINLPIPGVEMPTVPLDQYKAYLEINQLIYDGGLTKSYANILNLSATENLTKSTIQQKQIENNIAKIFFLALLLDKQIDVINNQLKTLNEQLNVVEASINGAVLTPVNRDILLSEILKIEQRLEETIILKTSTLNVLKQYTGQDLGSESELLFPYLSINSFDTSISPRMQLVDIQSQKLNLIDNQISASRKPNVYAFAQGGYGRPGLNMLSDEFSPYFIAGVTCSWRVFDWNNANRNRQINAIKNDQLSIDRHNIQVAINIQKENILAQLNSLQQTIHKDEQIIELQEKILNTYKSQLKNGIITSAEYVVEVNKLSQTQLTLELHKIQYEQLKFEYNNVY
ncbi:MAG: TolC family protein [Bacteroidales bacterium]|nr:TolC family protein [Bacteroidales bacterium]